ncbi:MAG: lactoylglutathione lyase [Micavibrio aeruginosavorus]|uniref:Lactoylglutathione lyase n=1 Tax=Micavibrio aeruginosavorus TaxID=349221 RepID=A0A2W5FMH1_9BACT|nr:MAG: lactoylglutathione lyase [Micavibrio aeruginosavorus]
MAIGQDGRVVSRGRIGLCVVRRKLLDRRPTIDLIGRRSPRQLRRTAGGQKVRAAIVGMDRHLDTLTGSETRQSPLLELTYNWDKEDYTGGRNFGHLAYEVDNIYEFCQSLVDQGIVINRPPRDGNMAFVKSPDGISIEILQKGDKLSPAEPWASMPNTGTW